VLSNAYKASLDVLPQDCSSFSFTTLILTLQTLSTMSFNKLAHLALLAPAAMGLVVPKGITPEQLDKMMPRGVDQPGNPRLDFGKDSCFSTGAIGENEVC
jgi:hypothetical protein